MKCILFRYLESLIRNQNNEEAKSIIEASNLHQKIQLHGSTLLHCSTQHGNQTITAYLLEKGFCINAQDSSGLTPLMYALIAQHDEVVETLLEAEADILVSNKKNLNSLYFLFERPRPKLHILKLVIDQLRKQCSDIDEAARELIDAGCLLNQVLFFKDAEILECMMQQGYRLEYPENHSADNIRHTLLHVAVILNEPDIVKVLIKYGSDVNAINGEGSIPLDYLYSEVDERDGKNQIEILRVLVNASPSTILHCGPDGFFQCASALMFGPHEAIRVLLDSNELDFETKDTANENTVFHYLAMNRNPGIVEELKLHTVKYNVNVLERNGDTPLRIAAYYANVSMLQFFLEKGAEINLQGNHHMQPTFFYAYANQYKPDLEYLGDKCVEVLLQYNADPQIIHNMDGELITIFDMDMTEKNNKRIERLKPVVAQLAFLEKLGTPIKEIIRDKINSQPSFEEYFARCQKKLDDKIAGNVSVFQLLTADKKKMAKYLNNQKLVAKLIRFGREQALTSSFSYYSSTLRKLFFKGMTYKTLKDEAANFIYQCSKGRLAKSSIITEQLIEFYLNDEDLRRLCKC